MQLDRKLLVFVTATLAGLGLLMVYSSSLTAKPSFLDQRYLMRQASFLAIGVITAAVASQASPDFWRKNSKPLLAVSIALLVAVLIPAVGAKINGARRWIRLGSVSIQPSELAKLALVVYLAAAMDQLREGIRQFWRGWFPLLLAPVGMGGLVLLEPDFGTAVFLIVIAGIMLFLGGVPIWHMLTVCGGAVPVIALLVLCQPYRVTRIFQFVAGWSDPSAAPYQVQQSLVALGSGGLWGSGLGQGWQKLGFLPEANTDFVFAVIGEELGLAGTLTVLALWAVFMICGVRLARRCASTHFAYLCSTGLISQIVFQAVLNMAVVTGSLPPKGISLPLLSAGGSNLVVSLLSVGMVLGMTNAASPLARGSEQRRFCAGLTLRVRVGP